MKTAMKLGMGLLLGLLLPAVAQAQFTFTTNNGAITITGYTGTNATVVIPDTTNGFPVTTIGVNAFKSITNLTGVTISDSITNIGDGAFWNCTNLTSVTVPNSVTSIGSFAFQSCQSLSGVTIPNNVTNIGPGAFRYCTSLTNATIGTGVISIGNNNFSGCSSLDAIAVDPLNAYYCSVAGVLFDLNRTMLVQYPGGKTGSYTVPDGVTSIGKYAFQSCSRLTSAIIPNGVTNLGNRAFFDCDKLKGVYFQGNAPGLGAEVFSQLILPIPAVIVFYLAGTTNWGATLEWQPTALWDPQMPYVYTTNNGAITITGYTGPGDTLVIPGTINDLPVTSIGSNAFAKWFNMDTVTIPNSITSIGTNAFANCTSLRSATIGNSVTNIGNLAFSHCGLTSVYFRGNAPSTGNGVFDFSGNTSAYYLPGTTNWTNPWQNRPTALWLPQPQTSDANFGVQTNQFGFNISWASGQTVVVEACTNLANPVWTPLQTNTLTGDAFYFSDPQWTNHPIRLYRLRSP